MKTITLLLVILLAGCADPFIHYRQGVPAERYYDDVADCEREVTRYASLIWDGHALHQLESHCMSEKGYTLTDPKTARPWDRKDVERRLAQ